MASASLDAPPRHRARAQRSAGVLQRLPAPVAAVCHRAASLGCFDSALRERAVVGALAGGLAGGVVNGVLHPLDTIKVRLQVRGTSFKGPGDVLRHALLLKRWSLYRGVGAAVLGGCASSSLYFGAYEACKALGLPPPLAALLGNALSSVFLVPKELVKSRLQAGAAGGARSVLAGVLKERGVRGVYAGYLPTLLRNAPSNCISFSTFEALKAQQLRRLARRRAHTHEAEGRTPVTLPAGEAALCGALSGALAATVTHPLDLVKTRLMTQGSRAPLGLSLYTGVAGTLRAVAREEGLRGLTRGLAVRLCYNTLFTALGMSAFEAARRGIAQQRALARAHSHDTRTKSA